MLRGFTTISYWADDVPAARAWYTELLGVEPYFERSGADGRLAYVEFRVGARQDELGLIDRGYAPRGAANGPGGVVMYWHVDDVRAALERVVSLGATPYQELVEREAGFVTASVVDPFGNVLGLMYSPHHLALAAGAA
ncbi:VOC family protein [Streptomyces sp. DSM 44915]|uniref:VOC family protein n=1 Tax=Streptomyces chisholmiae TaxID=3075540 RepID=A0ABU2JPC8_9ACTN|nr:VOC family protein [Streptomyces sp. DSM 44915]MDT0266063.1 VOC family protein [Streptomyces sp. DSM 44915]